MNKQKIRLVAVLGPLFFVGAALAQEAAAPEPEVDPELTRVDEMLETAREEIREFREAGGKDDDPEHPRRRWAEELWKVRAEHPGSAAADKATVESIHFMIHADQAREALERARSVPADDGAWSRLVNIVFEAAGEIGDYEPFLRQVEALDAFEFDPEKRASLRFQVAQARWVMGDLEGARAALREIADQAPGGEWTARLTAAREELGHPEIRDAEPSRRTPRDLWQRPGRVMEALDVGRGDKVADIGAGGGYFTFLLGWRTGESGRVHAVEIDEGMLERLAEEAAERGLENVETVLGAGDDPRLPAGELDAILVVDTYHEMEGHEGMLAGMFEALAPGGRLVIVDNTAAPGEERSVYVKRHQMPVELLIAEAAAAGFRLWSFDPEFASQPGGRESYLVVFVKGEDGGEGGSEAG